VLNDLSFAALIWDTARSTKSSPYYRRGRFWSEGSANNGSRLTELISWLGDVIRSTNNFGRQLQTSNFGRPTGWGRNRSYISISKGLYFCVCGGSKGRPRRPIWLWQRRQIQI